MKKNNKNWDYIIKPKYDLFQIDFNEIYKNVFLIFLFVWRDFVSFYKQTILGPLWYIIQPILTTLVFTIIFGKLANISTDGLPSFLFYMCGNVIWGYFSSCMIKTSTSLSANSNILGKVYFPRLVIPISILISNLIAFGIQLLIFILFIIWFKVNGSNISPSIYLIFAPYFLILMAGLGMGIGIIISSVTTKYRDLQFVITFGVQLLMYLTPVIFPLSSIPKNFQFLAMLNPMTPILEFFRFAFLGNGTVYIWNVIYCNFIVVIFIVIGLVIFNRVEKTFMDTV